MARRRSINEEKSFPFHAFFFLLYKSPTAGKNSVKKISFEMFQHISTQTLAAAANRACCRSYAFEG
jgi:hypothetical protein